MMRKSSWGLLVGCAIAALCGLLAACGVSSPGGLGASSTPAPSSTVVNGTPGTIHPTSTCTTVGNPACEPSPTPTSSATAPAGAVRLVLDKSSYAPGERAIVSIENGLSVKISVSNHHSDCTYVVLEQFVGGTWQAVEPCKLMTPTVLADLAPGSVTEQKLGIPSGANAAGTYRVMLAYFPAGSVPSSQQGPAYSATFTVG